MTARKTATAQAALLVGVALIAFLVGRSTSGRTGSPSPSGEGRYRVVAASEGSLGFVVLTDSVTGRTWFHYARRDSTWDDYQSPVPER